MRIWFRQSSLLRVYVVGSILWLLACKEAPGYLPAETGLDAGREFLDGCMKGDFSKARFYLKEDAANLQKLSETESAYRERDKEGRQQLRTASIRILELTEAGDSLVRIHYSQSNDNIPHWLFVMKDKKQWKVDYTR